MTKLFGLSISFCAIFFGTAASAQSVPAGYKTCGIVTPCDTLRKEDGFVVCPYIPSDDHALKDYYLRAACVMNYGPTTGYQGTVGGHPACVVQSYVPVNVPCP
jgi:hypothetical protein